jgi:hypothetical protein
MTTTTLPGNSRLRAAVIHLGVSACIAALAAGFVFLVWYPSSMSALAGGINLFSILVSVDVVMGPALTFVAASPGKPKRELARDLSIIVVLQLAAFCYGLYTMALARPVALVYEVDRFRVITAADIEPALLGEAPAELATLSWTGPKTIAVVKPTEAGELLRSIELGLAGVPLAALPKYWRTYASQAEAAWQRARPLSVLQARYPQTASQLAAISATANLPQSTLRFLPVQARHANAVAILAEPSARIVGYVPVDGDF